ncbi:MAG: VWA domain-containing protein [Bacillota bacterium]|nr:VWA domain-containing protein [Bacillota bacterium]
MKRIKKILLSLSLVITFIPINVFALDQDESAPLDITFVLDASGSMDDPLSKEDSTKRINLLNELVYQFIDQYAKKNSYRDDITKQSRISIIKFAGNKSDRIGNETYSDKGYRYNYTQIVSNYVAITEENKESLKTKVKDIKPAGATRADIAMELTKKLVDESINDNSRKYVKRVIIFITDGAPTSQSDFEDKVANNAISMAKNIKEKAKMYTVGMSSNTDISISGDDGDGNWTDIEKFNAYMYGMSSNYLDAESYDQLGQKDNNEDYYKGFKNSLEAETTFNEIIHSLSKILYDCADYTKVNEAKSKVPNDLSIYTDETVEALQNALDAIEEGKNITEQEMVDGYADTLIAAIESLTVKPADYTKVEKAINQAKSLNKDHYEDFSKVTEAIDSVAYDKNMFEQEIVDNYAKAINEAIKSLVPKPANYTKVEAAINRAKSLNKDYYKDFSKVIEAIDAVNYNKNILEQEIVDNYANAINKAISELKYKDADYTKVNEAKSKIPTDLSIYTDETVKVLKDALALVEEGKNVTEQNIVDGYEDIIYKAIKSLILKSADYTKVEEAIAKAKSLNKDYYVDFSKVAEAIESVVYNKNILEQATVDNYADTITKAIEGLVKKNISYKVIEGENETFVKESGNDHAIRIDHEFTEDVKVEIDGQEVNKLHYKVTKGSTIITFDDDYLNTLSVGTHHVKVTFEDGVATTTLILKEQIKDDKRNESTSNNQETIKPMVKAENKQEVKKVKTGDDENIIGIALLLIGSLVVLTYLRKKKID